MTACIVGTIVEIKSKSIVIEDRLTKQHYTCETEGDAFLDLKVNEQGVFVGQYYNSVLKVHKIEVRKFLDPFYEKDLYEISGKFSLIPVINDPFTETYLKYLEAQKEIDEQLNTQPSEST